MGWDRLVGVEDCCKPQAEFSLKDAAQRVHSVRVRFGSEYPNVAPVVDVDLPGPVQTQWGSHGTTLSSLLGEVEASLSAFQPFWAAMDDLDANTIVIEPKQPTRSATNRRIALGNQASLQIWLDPREPHREPEVRCFGGNKVVGPLNEAWAQDGPRWSQSETPSQNLERVLGIELPRPEQRQASSNINEDCGICYAPCEDTADQAIKCEDARCVQKFHHSCLLGWLRGLPSTRHSFDTLLGECPYCSGDISCPKM